LEKQGEIEIWKIVGLTLNIGIPIRSEGEYGGNAISNRRLPWWGFAKMKRGSSFLRDSEEWERPP